MAKFQKKNYLIISLFLITILTIISSSNCQSKNLTKKEVNPKNYTSFFVNSTIKTADDNNFDKLVARGRLGDVLILFTIKRCPSCNNIIKSVENVENYYKKNSDTDLKFLKVDCFMSGWTAMRFNLERLPNILFITNGSYSVYPKEENITEEGIFEFIKKKEKVFFPFPRRMGYLDLFMKLFHIISDLLKEKFSFWNEGYSWGIVCVIIVLFCIIEYLIFKLCCQRKHKDKGDKNKNVNQHLHQHTHINKEEKEKNFTSNGNRINKKVRNNLGYALNNKRKME